MTEIYCDMCGKRVDKTEKTNGFGAMTLITKQYILTKSGKVGEQTLTPKDFDICSECCENLLKFVKESKQQASKKVTPKQQEKVEAK